MNMKSHGIQFDQLADYRDQYVTVHASIETLHHLSTRKGQPIIFGSLKDDFGLCDFIVHEEQIRNFQESYSESVGKIDFTGIVKEVGKNTFTIVYWKQNDPHLSDFKVRTAPSSSR